MGEAGTPTREPHNRFDEEAREVFLQELSETVHVRHSAARAGVSSSTAYRAYRSDPDFAARWMEALRLGYVRLEEKLLALALRRLRGADEMPAGDGGVVGVGERTGDLDGAEEPTSPDDVLRAPERNGGARATRSAFTDTRLAWALLNRHKAAVQRGTLLSPRARWKATAEDTDATLRRLLDDLALRRSKGR